jgi:hypothetical protein
VLSPKLALVVLLPLLLLGSDDAGEEEEVEDWLVLVLVLLPLPICELVEKGLRKMPLIQAGTYACILSIFFSYFLLFY